MESVEDGVMGAGDQELKANAWEGRLCGPGHQEGRQESLQRVTRHSSVMILDRASGSLPLVHVRQERCSSSGGWNVAGGPGLGDGDLRLQGHKSQMQLSRTAGAWYC